MILKKVLIISFIISSCYQAHSQVLLTLIFGDKITEISEGSVGYPVEGLGVLLLDDAGAEVDPGEEGEIAIKSRYVAHGYWNNPESTQKKFLPDPHGTDERIYLSGDLGRVLPDGCLPASAVSDSALECTLP